MWTQIVGKLRMAAAPPASHWWQIQLYLTSRGLGTSAIPYGERLFEMDFDFIDHQLVVSESGGRTVFLELAPTTVASFHRELINGLRSLDIELPIWTTPVEVADPIPFERDEIHASYDRGHAHVLWLALVQAHRVLTQFRARFIGKASPVHFYWGSFDLAVERFSGRRAPIHPGGGLNVGDWVMEEAYSHELSAAGWWPGSTASGPLFYSYMYPEPAGFRQATVRPDLASFSEQLGEFVLPYEALPAAAEPDAMVREFLESTYRAGADLADWDRDLEPVTYPSRRPPRRAWSTLSAAAQPSDSSGEGRARAGSGPPT